MDAIEVLRSDQHTIRQLFEAYERAASFERKEELALRLIAQLSVHASIEETILVPCTRNRSPELLALIRRVEEAHHVIAATLTDLERLLGRSAVSAARDNRMDAIVGTLLEQVCDRVEEDTIHLFPALRRELNQPELDSVGLLLMHGRQNARRHPPRVHRVPSMIALCAS